jgi:hypothetical protein
MSLVLQSSGGGQITIQEPATASNFTQTLPAASGEVMVSGNQPAFRAFNNSGGQSVTSSTFTKILFDTELFDTNNNFASSRFTPTVAGYYQINCSLAFSGTVITRTIMSIYKNGSVDTYGTDINSGVNTGVVTGLIFCNGTTDYIEIYGWIAATSPVISSSPFYSFNGCLVRAA